MIASRCITIRKRARTSPIPICSRSTPSGFTGGIKRINSELAAAGRAGTPIYMGEIGSATAPGDKQEMSITQALYAGQLIGEMLNDGIARATWHSGYGDCQLPSKGGDFSPTLYGKQNYGGSMIFSVGTLRYGCSNPDVPLGTLMPTAVSFEVASHFVRNGEHMLGVSVVGMTAFVPTRRRTTAAMR